MKCYIIVNTDNEYLTKQSIDAKYTFTKNKNYAYCYDNRIIAQKIIDALFDNTVVSVQEIDLS